MKPVKQIDFGFGDIVDIQYLQEVFGVSKKTALAYLKALRIKPVYIGKHVFFSLPTLNRILFVLMKPLGEGFVAPGTTYKRSPRVCGKPGHLFEVTDEILKQAADPKILAEMAASTGRNMDVVKQFITKPVGRPRKKKDDE